MCSTPQPAKCRPRSRFASRAEMRKAVDAAIKVFPEWAAVNPQRRARVMFNFKSLVEKNMDQLALAHAFRRARQGAGGSARRHPARVLK